MNEGRLTNIQSTGEEIFSREIPPLIRRGNVAASSTIKVGDLLTRDSYGKIKRFARTQSGSPAADVAISGSDVVTIIGVAMEDVTTAADATTTYVDYVAFGCITHAVQVGASETALSSAEKDALSRVGLFLN